MLVLTRESNQSIEIGGGIVVTVLSVRRGKVRIGITAPKDVLLLRTELKDDPKCGPANCQVDGLPAGDT